MFFSSVEYNHEQAMAEVLAYIENQMAPQTNPLLTFASQYTSAYTGAVDGIADFDPTAYEVVLFVETDVPYLQGRSDINATTKAWSVNSAAGIKIAKVVTKQGTAPTGTVTTVGTAVGGSGTNFESCAEVGGSIIINNQQRYIVSIIDDETMTINAVLSADVAGAAYDTVGIIQAKTVSDGSQLVLPRSYTIPLDDPTEVETTLPTRNFVYDAALVLMVCASTRNTSLGARIVAGLDAAVTATDAALGTTGALCFSTNAYDVTQGAALTTTRTGASAWCAYALAIYYEKTGDASALTLSKKIADYLISLLIQEQGDYRDGMLLGGPDVAWVSCEHNTDAYYMCKKLFAITGLSTYENTRDAIASGMLNSLYDPEYGLPRFCQGTAAADRDYAEALDIYSWAGCFLLDQGETDKAVAVANRMFTKFFLQDKTIALEDNLDQYYNQTYRTDLLIDGVKTYAVTTDGDTSDTYVDPPDLVWQEGGQGVLLFLKRLQKNNLHGSVTNFDTYLKRILAGQRTIFAAARSNTYGKGSLLAWTGSDRLLPYEFQVWPSTAATCWFYLVENEPDIFWYE